MKIKAKQARKIPLGTHLPNSNLSAPKFSPVKCSENDQGEGQWHQVRAEMVRKESSRVKPTSEMRAVEQELVLITDFIPELLSDQIIRRPCYFSRYGKVTKTIFASKTFRRRISQLAFITYKNHLDAAMAIVAMQYFRHMSFNCTTTYGTVRYCPAFIKNLECTFKDCYFMHKLGNQNLTVEMMRTMSHKQKIQPAIDLIHDNLEYFIQKEHLEYLDSKIKKKQNGLVYCHCNSQNKGKAIVLPSIKDTLQWLVCDRDISRGDYERLKNQYKAKVKAKYAAKRKEEKDGEKDQESEVKSDVSTPEKEVSEQDDQNSTGNFSLLKTGQPLIEVNLKGKLEQQFMPYLLQRFLDPEVKKKESKSELEMYYRNREIEMRQKIHNGHSTLPMYQRLMNPQKALSSYIHHKLIQEVNWRSPPLSVMFPQAANHPGHPHYPSNSQACRNFKKIVYSCLIQ